MYQYPYGNAQQLNLDWILSKLQEVEEGSGATLEEVSNALIALTYAEQNYNLSDIVFHNGKLYSANQNITAESWNPNHWNEVLLANPVSNLVRYVSALNNSQVYNTSNVAGTHTSDALNALNGALNTFLVADTTWEQGSISGTGAETVSTTRIRTKNYIPVTKAESVSGVVDSGYMFSVSWYNSSKTFISDSGWNNTTAKVEKPAGAAFCRIILALTNNDPITPDASVHIEVRLDMTVKNAIDTVNDKAKYDIYDEGIYAYNNPILAAYTTGSGNYIDFFLPIKVNPILTIAATYEQSYRHEGDLGDTHTTAYLLDGKIDATVAMNANITILKKTESGITFEIGFTNTQTPAKPATICVARLVITATR